MQKPARAVNSLHILTKAVVAVALTLCLGAGAQAKQQEQNPPPPPQDQQQAPPAPQNQQAQPQDQGSNPPAAAAPATPSKPTYASQDANRPPYSNDRTMQSQSGPYGPPQSRTMQSQRGQYPPQQPSGPVPSTLTIPPGTILTVRVNDYLSSDKSKVGDQFTATLDRQLS